MRLLRMLWTIHDDDFHLAFDLHTFVQCANMQHLERNFHDVGGDVIHSDSGILLLSLDSNTDRYVKSLPALHSAKSVICHDLPYCGWPYYFPMIAFVSVE